jgi:hypothetical protein
MTTICLKCLKFSISIADGSFGAKSVMGHDCLRRSSWGFSGNSFCDKRSSFFPDARVNAHLSHIHHLFSNTTNFSEYTTNPSGYTTNLPGYTTNPSGYTTNPSGYTTNPSGYTTNLSGYTNNFRLHANFSRNHIAKPGKMPSEHCRISNISSNSISNIIH